MTAELTYDTLNTLALWQHVGSITLDEMERVKLMNRIDTKYVLSYEEVLRLLEILCSQGYKVQVIGGIRAARYDTLYYDTAGRQMYIMHHNQHLTRQKVRTRNYLESGATFLEIKNKSNRGRTRKRRIAIERSNLRCFYHDAAAKAFYDEQGWYPTSLITPALATRFTRITLVNPMLTERLTIDLELRYEDVRSGRQASIRNMAIVELKQDGLCASATKSAMQQLRVMPLRVSKYCLGTVLTVADIKQNRYKQKLRSIEKRLGGLEILSR